MNSPASSLPTENHLGLARHLPLIRFARDPAFSFVGPEKPSGVYPREGRALVKHGHHARLGLGAVPDRRVNTVRPTGGLQPPGSAYGEWRQSLRSHSPALRKVDHVVSQRDASRSQNTHDDGPQALPSLSGLVVAPTHVSALLSNHRSTARWVRSSTPQGQFNLRGRP